MTDKSRQVADLIENAPSIGKSVSSTAAAGGSAAGSFALGLDQWLTVAGMAIAVVGLVFSGVSIYVAWRRLKAQERANQLKEQENWRRGI